MHGKPVDASSNQTFRKYATIISKCIDLRGAWFFQIKEDQNGVLKLLEIAPHLVERWLLIECRGLISLC